jgi:hypothetical protein
MSVELQIDCVTRDDRLSPYERIQRVGGMSVPGLTVPDGSTIIAHLRKRGLAVKEKPRWNLSIREAIEGVVDGKWSFYVELDMRGVLNVQVARTSSGTLYLKTETDRDTPDHLLCLPLCR